jgi:hypothetical protein
MRPAPCHPFLYFPKYESRREWGFYFVLAISKTAVYAFSILWEVQMPHQTPVHKNYEIDLEELKRRACENDYWMKALRFYEDMSGKFVSELTPKQMLWLEKIEESLK